MTRAISKRAWLEPRLENPQHRQPAEEDSVSQKSRPTKLYTKIAAFKRDRRKALSTNLK